MAALPIVSGQPIFANKAEGESAQEIFNVVWGIVLNYKSPSNGKFACRMTSYSYVDIFEDNVFVEYSDQSIENAKFGSVRKCIQHRCKENNVKRIGEAFLKVGHEFAKERGLLDPHATSNYDKKIRSNNLIYNLENPEQFINSLSCQQVNVAFLVYDSCASYRSYECGEVVSGEDELSEERSLTRERFDP